MFNQGSDRLTDTHISLTKRPEVENFFLQNTGQFIFFEVRITGAHTIPCAYISVYNINQVKAWIIKIIIIIIFYSPIINIQFNKIGHGKLNSVTWALTITFICVP